MNCFNDSFAFSYEGGKIMSKGMKACGEIFRTLALMALGLSFIITSISLALGEEMTSTAIYDNYAEQYGAPGISWNQEIWREFSENLRKADITDEALRYIAFHAYEEIDTSYTGAFYHPLSRDEAIAFAKGIAGTILGDTEAWTPYALCMHMILENSGHAWKVTFFRGNERVTMAFFAENEQIIEPPRALPEDAPWYEPFILHEAKTYEALVRTALSDPACPERIVQAMTADLTGRTIIELLISDVNNYGRPPFIGADQMSVFYVDPTQGSWPTRNLLHVDFLQRALRHASNSEIPMYQEEKSYASLPLESELQEDTLERIAVQYLKQHGYENMIRMRACCFGNVFDAETFERYETVWVIEAQLDDNHFITLYIDAQTQEELFNLMGTSDSTVG